MNYELAKQLKDSGFPQKIEWPTICIQDNITGHELSERCKVPPLHELIEACDRSLTFLKRIVDHSTLTKGSKYDKWHAGNEILFMKGSTPEESVANLWLELNKK